MHIMAKRMWLLVLLPVLMAACMPRQLIIEETAALVADGTVAMEADDDLDMLARALPAHIKLLEGLLASDPDNQRLLVLLAKLYAFYAFAVVEDRPLAVSVGLEDGHDDGLAGNWKNLADRYYRLGVAYGLRAMECRDPAIKAKLTMTAKRPAALAQMTAGQVPALFWYGFNLAGSVNQNRDSVRALAQIGQVRDIMQRVRTLDPDFFHRGALLVLMAVDGSAPPAMGGRPQAVDRWYRHSLAPDDSPYLLADLFYARYGLRSQGKPEAARALLEKIIASPPAAGQRKLLDTIARRRARQDLSHWPLEETGGKEKGS